MKKLIYKPLCALRGLLVGPRNLIRKRLDKLLDFELIESKPSLCYEEQSVANTYRYSFYSTTQKQGYLKKIHKNIP